MRIRFVKMHGAGNDFVLVDDRDGSFPCERSILAAIGARGTGIGCEGIILVQRSERVDFRMRFFNPDGSEAELCGNGARCVAAFAREIGDREEVSLEYAARKAQMAADRELRELDDVENADDDEEVAAKKRRRKRNEPKKNDVVLEESYKVLMDLVRMKGGEEVPEMKGWWY